MQIRKGKISDFKELMAVLNSTPQLQDYKDERCYYSEEWVKDSIRDGLHNLVLVADDSGKIGGFLLAEFWKNKSFAEMVALYVKPEYRQRGIATLLVNEFEKVCMERKVTSISALVLVTNKRMQNFMKKKEYKKGNIFYFYGKQIR
ncbi:MAG: GNAT family N-acetyltransferase [Candidatus Woesearchaeota archaeon]|nr:GNAT family N-acetyltransferase [Candidatus Woesearchaeota archaeon]